MEKLSSLSFDMGPIRPPSEGGSSSLLIRVTRNCPWNRCKFCYGTPYRREKFELRDVADVKEDIDTAGKIRDEIVRVAGDLGTNGAINNAVANMMIQNDPQLSASHSFAVVFNWLSSGGRTAFLQDADSLTLKTPQMVEIITYLRQTFPSLNRITTYARAKTIYRKSPEELTSLVDAGLSRLHIGLESGDDEVLKYVEKGVTSEQHIVAGRKAKQAGLQLSEYIMPGLGGRRLSHQHALNTARVLNEINPDYIRSRALIPGRGTPIYDDYQTGTFQLTSPHERLREVQTLVEALNVTSRLCFDHFMNSWRDESGGVLFTQDYEGYQMPEEKTRVLGLIRKGLALDESMHINAKDLIEMRYL